MQVLFHFIQQLIKKENLLIFTDQDDGDSADNIDAGNAISTDDGTKKRFEDTTYMSMIELFYNTMDHNSLMACLKELLKQLTMGPLSSDSGTIKDTLRKMLSSPRSLKSISRHAIYKSLNHDRLVGKVSKLDLPLRIKHYLLDFKS